MTAPVDGAQQVIVLTDSGSPTPAVHGDVCTTAGIVHRALQLQRGAGDRVADVQRKDRVAFADADICTLQPQTHGTGARIGSHQIEDANLRGVGDG